MSTERIPQYAKSVAPAVIATIQRNRAGILEWQTRASEFAEKHGAPNGAFYPSTFAGRFSIYALATPIAPTDGRWKRQGRGWAPYKNNPISADMDAIRFSKEPVPGLPGLVHSRQNADWQHYVMTPAPFVWDDTAWVGFAHEPDPEGNEPIGAEWVEVLASQFHAAREAVSR